jgi:hypothetical protein
VFLRYQKGEKKMEKEEKSKNQNQSETSNQNQSQNNQNSEQQSFLGAASFTKEGAVGSNPTPRIKNKAL